MRLFGIMGMEQVKGGIEKAIGDKKDTAKFVGFEELHKEIQLGILGGKDGTRLQEQANRHLGNMEALQGDEVAKMDRLINAVET